MTIRNRILMAGAMTLLSALAIFAAATNLGAFRGEGDSDEPPAQLVVEGTAFVSETEAGIADLLALQQQLGGPADAGYDDGDEGHEAYDDDDEYEEHDEGDEHGEDEYEEHEDDD